MSNLSFCSFVLSDMEREESPSPGVTVNLPVLPISTVCFIYVNLCSGTEVNTFRTFSKVNIHTDAYILISVYVIFSFLKCL